MLWIKKIHKWLSVFIGIQFLLWLLSGVYFNLMDHTKASGHTYRSHEHAVVNFDLQKFVEPKSVLTQQNPSVVLSTIELLGKPYYLLTHKKGLYRNFINHYSLVNAYSGETTEIDSAMANALASQSYSGPGEIIATTLLTSKVADFPKQYNPTWQINFNDEVNTSVYIEAGSGRVVGHSDDDKRLADIAFMLHFMDYASEGSFNNIQIILFAFFTLWLSLTGLIWTVDLGFRGQYQIKLFAKQRKVRLFDKHQKSMGDITLSSHSNLLDGLIEHDIALPSTCGGGGTCGRCKVMINPVTNTTSADHQHFSDKELQQGYRLACQHFSNDVKQMTLIDVTEAKKHALLLTSSTFVSPYIKELRFKVKGGAALSYKAGAFMRFFIPASKGCSVPMQLPEELKPHWHHIEKLDYEHLACTRSYSIATSADTTDELVFTIKIQSAPHHKVLPGVGSSYLCNLAPGQSVDAIGPFEEFFASENSNKTMVLVGAGSGMAPLKSLIEEQTALASKNGNPERNIYFFYGARKESDLLYADEFYHLANHNDHFHYFPTLSRADENWLGSTGYVQQMLELNLDSIDNLENIEFYLCGPSLLMTETIAMLTAKGVADSAITFDDFN
ncbi:2Fe-2S iron-sulfur cluster-binding protein [Thalassotalea sp. ND16A]|uniref:2Fe-2S iron-sulfur cluster-binding protein n=1 Tax=Thalassotalea sp. ND16A TaxID=1535422 RepID=UPI00051A05A9|nr:2Fe-2S iron-sulfur cluster-binding protein [Thalassotalea sp. ND16A]KGK00139.1 hypothetical protein ND16A_0330 [Thalassotalea sp. ND16A]